MNPESPIIDAQANRLKTINISLSSHNSLSKTTKKKDLHDEIQNPSTLDDLVQAKILTNLDRDQGAARKDVKASLTNHLRDFSSIDLQKTRKLQQASAENTKMNKSVDELSKKQRKLRIDVFLTKKK